MQKLATVAVRKNTDYIFCSRRIRIIPAAFFLQEKTFFFLLLTFSHRKYMGRSDSYAFVVTFLVLSYSILVLWSTRLSRSLST